MAFGTAQRTAAQDANEGIVNPPAKKHVARSTQSTKTKQSSSLELGVEKIGETLGSALQARVDKEFTNIRARQMLEGARAQGTETALNTIEEDKKRTGMGAAVFGQNASYRGAQQQAVKNNINKEYLDLSYTISTYADKSPEEFAGVLQHRLDTMMSVSKVDLETGDMIAENWASASQKLIEAHYKEHYGWVQQENMKEARQKMRGDSDTWYADFTKLPRDGDGGVLINDASRALFKQAEGMFDHATDAPDMNKNSWEQMKNEEINYALKNGNVALYHMAQTYGWEKDLHPELAVQRDTALGKYDGTQEKSGNILYQETLGALNDPAKTGSTEQFEAYLQNYQDSVDQLANKESGTLRGRENIETLRNKFIHLQRAAGDANKKRIAKELMMEQGFQAIDNIRNGVEEGTGGWASINKTSDKQDILDAYIVDMFNNKLPEGEQLAPGDVMNGVFDNPIHSKEVADVLGSMDVSSPLFKSAANTVVASAWNMSNQEEGSPQYGHFSEQTKRRIQSLTQFEHIPGFTDIFGDDGIKYEMLKQAMEMDQTVEESKRETALLLENRQDRTTYGAKTFDKDGTQTNTREHLTKLLSNLQGGKDIAASTLSEYTLKFADGMAIYKGDVGAANNYVTRAHKTNTIHMGGRTVANAQSLNNYTKGTMYYKDENGNRVSEEVALSPADLIKGMELQSPNSRDEITLMGGVLGLMLGSASKGKNKLSDVPGYTLERDYITGGLILTVPGAPMHYTFTPEKLSEFTVQVSHLARINGEAHEAIEENTLRMDNLPDSMPEHIRQQLDTTGEQTTPKGKGGGAGAKLAVTSALQPTVQKIIDATEARKTQLKSAKALTRNGTGKEPINRDRNSVFTKAGTKKAIEVQHVLEDAGIPKSLIKFTSNERLANNFEPTWNNMTKKDGSFNSKTYANAYAPLHKTWRNAKTAAAKATAKQAIADLYNSRSSHGKATGLDLSVKGMTTAQELLLMSTLRANGYTVLDERTNDEPHIHFEW